VNGGQRAPAPPSMAAVMAGVKASACELAIEGMPIIQPSPMSIARAQVGMAPPLEPLSALARYSDVRRTTERLCRPLSVEDHVIQAMPDVSPTKWHLAHVSWFLRDVPAGPAPAGLRAARPRLSCAVQFLLQRRRPAVLATGSRQPLAPLRRRDPRLRGWVDRGMATLIQDGHEARLATAEPLIELG